MWWHTDVLCRNAVGRTRVLGGAQAREEGENEGKETSSPLSSRRVDTTTRCVVNTVHGHHLGGEWKWKWEWEEARGEVDGGRSFYTYLPNFPQPGSALIDYM